MSHVAHVKFPVKFSLLSSIMSSYKNIVDYYIMKIANNNNQHSFFHKHALVAHDIEHRGQEFVSIQLVAIKATALESFISDYKIYINSNKNISK